MLATILNGHEPQHALQELQADLAQIMTLSLQRSEYQLGYYPPNGSKYVRHRYISLTHCLKHNYATEANAVKIADTILGHHGRLQYFRALDSCACCMLEMYCFAGMPFLTTALRMINAG